MSQNIIEAESRELEPHKDFDIDAFISKRKEFIEKVNAIMVEGKDYHVIQGRKSMAKGGAEKIASIFGWTASFAKDQDAMEAFKDVAGIICFICNLTKHGQEVGQGRGAAVLAKNNGDPNKTLKMAQKSAFIDAVIRASGLSDFYTQDLGPEDEGSSYGHTSSQPAQKSSQKPKFEATAQRADRPASEAQLKYIRGLMEMKGYSVGDLIDQGFADITKMMMSEAKECIDFLLKAKSKVNPNGDPIEEVPV